jgi:hypothetical protein
MHKEFADLRFFGWADAGGVKPKPRGFQVETALLQFVNKYGFLSGSDVEEEPVDRLLSYQDTLASIASTGSATATFAPALLRLGKVQTIEGPNMRACLIKDGGAVRLVYKPESLYAWMWWRALEDLQSGVSYDGPPCLWCKRPIGRGPKPGRRIDALFCSPQCRARFDHAKVPETEKAEREARKDRAIARLMEIYGADRIRGGRR